MSGSFLVKLVLIVLAVCAGAYFYNHLDVKSKKAELEIEKPLLQTLRNKLDDVQLDIDTLQEKIRLCEEEIARQQSRESQRIDIPALEAERDRLWDDLASHVQYVRSSLTGKNLPEITLENGQILQGVRVQKASEDGLTVAHLQGIAKIPLSRLPADLKARLRVGMSPPESRTPAVAAATSSPASAAIPPAVVAAKVPPPADPILTATQKEGIAKLNAQINALVVQHAELDRTKTAYINQTNIYRVRDAESVLAGKRPRYANIIPRMDASTRELMSRIGEIKVAVANIQIQIEGIKNAKQ